MMAENRDAVKIWSLCQRQLIFPPMAGPIDIDHAAVHEAMNLYRVENKKSCFEKVLYLAGHFIGEKGK